MGSRSCTMPLSLRLLLGGRPGVRHITLCFVVAMSASAESILDGALGRPPDETAESVSAQASPGKCVIDRAARLRVAILIAIAVSDHPGNFVCFPHCAIMSRWDQFWAEERCWMTCPCRPFWLKLAL